MNPEFLWQRSKQFAPELSLIAGLSLIGSLATLTLPWLGAQFLGGIVGEAEIDLTQSLLLLALALSAQTCMQIGIAVFSELATGRILSQLRRETYDHVQNMPMGAHDSSSTGDLIGLMTHDVNVLSDFFTSTIAGLPSLLFTAFGAVVLLFWLDPTMALIVPIVVPLFFLVMRLIGRRLRLLGVEVREAEVELVSLGERDLEMLPAIKSFATEDQSQRRFAHAAEEARKLSFRQTRELSFIGPMVSLIAAIAAIVILIAGSESLETGTRSPSELFAFLLYAALLTRPIGGLANTYGSFQMARGIMARLEAALTVPIEEGYSASKLIKRAKGAIAFENVSFAYEGRSPVLCGVSLRIPPGEIIALTGENGVGKSTLIRLLLRFYKPDSGRITLDGIDTAEIQVQSLRRQFGYVPQRPLLFNGSLRENIAFGDDVPDNERIVRSARLAQATSFIDALPAGLDTEIGDHGIRLSGGQRQRIALARALYRDPPIYILDEATSMYDLESEAAFVEDCVESLAERTVVIITHRPASLALATRVYEVTSEAISEAKT